MERSQQPASRPRMRLQRVPTRCDRCLRTLIFLKIGVDKTWLQACTFGAWQVEPKSKLFPKTLADQDSAHAPGPAKLTISASMRSVCV
jgi:hypothetical protein